MSDLSALPGIRRQYPDVSLDEKNMPACPIAQFEQWLDDYLTTEALAEVPMVLSTVDNQGCPDSRVVLLKGLEQGQFLFYTDYRSTKAQHIDYSHHVALNFYWSTLARQVRIRGIIQKTSPEKSDQYFASRPLASQLSSMLFAQSSVVSGREELEKAYQDLVSQHTEASLVSRPVGWGGYAVTPLEMEFWQGRPDRLSDRVHYARCDDAWVRCRLSP